MAQTKRKRRTKHRGNAAGMVEARGRTGRKPDAPSRAARGARRAGAPDRFDQAADLAQRDPARRRSRRSLFVRRA